MYELEVGSKVVWFYAKFVHVFVCLAVNPVSCMCLDLEEFYLNI